MMFLVGSFLHAQKSISIGYVDTEYVLENIEEYSNANSQLDTKATQWKAEIEKQLSSLDDEKKKLINERILLTNELIAEREEDLQIIENEIIDYQQKRFGPGGDLMIQKKQLIQPIQDQIFAAVQEIASSKKYDIIFDKSADVIMLYSADRYDISDQVLRTINRASKRTQLQTKKERKQAKEEETIVELDSGKSERQKILDERKAERKALLDKKRQEQIKAKEIRKKELEDKKRKKIEQRNKNQKTKENNSLDTSSKTKDGDPSSEKILSPKEQRKKELEERKLQRKELLDKKREDQLKAKETRKKELESTKQSKNHANTEEQKLSSETSAQESNQEPSIDTKLSPREKRKKELEERKKALKEKKEKELEDRKSRLEAQRKKRDSIKNNK